MKIFGEHDEGTLEQLKDVASQAEHTAIMADGHHGYYMPIGGVAAYRDKVCPAGVGYDIACGNAALKTNLQYDPNEDHPDFKKFGKLIWDNISFGLKEGRQNKSKDAPIHHPIFQDNRWELIPKGNIRNDLWAKARAQLGTIGSGNHYVDLLLDKEGFMWIGVHFGSRGFGHTIAHNYMAIAGGVVGYWGEKAKTKGKGVLLDTTQPSGEDYLNLMELAGEYAYQGRDWVINKVYELINATDKLYYVHNHHNFAWKEKHFGESFFVIRKGATPAFPGQEGFVGGSMGDDCVILEGNTNSAEEIRKIQEQALFSTVHGAGRLFSRGHAKRTIQQKDVNNWLESRRVHVFGGGLDESPQAYRRLNEVLINQGETITIKNILKPVVVCMAGPGV